MFVPNGTFHTIFALNGCLLPAYSKRTNLNHSLLSHNPIPPTELVRFACWRSLPSFPRWLTMMQVKNHVLCLMLFVQLAPSVGATSWSQESTNRGIMERLSLGKMWNVYIKANIFDIVVHTFRMKTKDSNAIFVSLRGVLTQMNRFKISRYPCPNLNIFFDRSIFHDATRKNGSSHSEFLPTQSKICGSMSRSFGLIASPIIRQETHDRGLTWLWQIHVNKHFIINVTFLSLESRFYPPCITRRAILEEKRNIDLTQKRTLGVFCPNNPPQSFYSTGNNVVINVHTWRVYEDFFLKNVYINQWIGSVSFTYEILDNDLSFDSWIEKRLPAGKDDYDYPSKLTKYVTLPWIHIAKYLETNVSHWEKNQNPFVESKEDMSNPYLFQIFESKEDIMYVFHFQSYIGATIAVKHGSLTCAKSQATLLAFEGPIVDLTWVESLLAFLQQWNCGHRLSGKDPSSELKGRIGDMTILFFVESKIDFYSLKLELAYRRVDENPEFAVREKLVLENSSSISFEQKGTYYYSFYIVGAGRGFVKIHFDHIFFQGYTDQACTYGGLYIVKVFSSYARYVGGMCSHKAARPFQRIYARQGLTLNDEVQVYVKQYYLLFLAHLILRFSLDQCLGLDNLYFYLNRAPVVDVPDGEGHVKLLAEYKDPYYAYGSNFYYRWQRDASLKALVGIERNNGTLCYEIHYVNFDTIGVGINKRLDINKVVAGIGNAENIRPPQIWMAFWNMDEEFKHFDNCLVNAFRFFPDNQNNEPYILLRLPEEDSWVTHAFAAKFALDNTCLIFGGAFYWRVQEQVDSHHSQCFTEVGGYLYDDVHPIVPKGVCGRILVNLYSLGRLKSNRVGFHRPLLHARCCHFNMLVKSTSTPCIRNASADRREKLHYGNFHDFVFWSDPINGTEMFTWGVPCVQNGAYKLYIIFGYGDAPSLVETCLDIAFTVLRTCDIVIYYRMSLLPSEFRAFTLDSLQAQSMCQGDTCYIITPILLYTNIPMSWDDAQAECMKLNGSIVAVNSDTEWRYLMDNIIRHRKDFTEMIYIGFHTVSNHFHNEVFRSVIYGTIWTFCVSRYV